MRHAFVFAFLFLFACTLVPLSVAAPSRGVLIVVRAMDREDPETLELMLTQEVQVMADRLEKAGFDVSIATETGESVEAGTGRLQPDLKIKDVKTADYLGVIFPCMAVGWENVPLTPEVEAVIRDAVSQGKPVAAQLSAVVTLARAGVLSGKRFAFYSEEAATQIPPFKGAVYGGTGIVQDGNIITSGVCPYAASSSELPDGTGELTQALISALSKKL